MLGDCDAGTVAKVREALAQGGNQYRNLRDVTETLKKKAESASGGQAQRWHLKLGIALFFLQSQTISEFLSDLFGGKTQQTPPATSSWKN